MCTLLYIRWFEILTADLKTYKSIYKSIAATGLRTLTQNDCKYHKTQIKHNTVLLEIQKSNMQSQIIILPEAPVLVLNGPNLLPDVCATY